LVEAYNKWDPETDGSIEDLAESLGVSKTTLYSTLAKANVPLRGGRSSDTYSQAEVMARLALDSLLERLEQLTARNVELERENEALRQQLGLNLQTELSRGDSVRR